MLEDLYINISLSIFIIYFILLFPLFPWRTCRVCKSRCVKMEKLNHIIYRCTACNCVFLSEFSLS